MSSSEIEENVNKIKELLKSEDFGVVNTGLELARSLDEEAVYEKLLEGCGVDKEGWLVNEKREISNYLVCSLASISNGQKAKEILDNVTKLDLNWDESLTNIDGLANLTNLTSLSLTFCESLINVDGLAKLTNLVELNLSNSLTNVDVLAKLTNLVELNLSNSLTNVDVLANLKNLTVLGLSGCKSLTNIDGLANLTNLTSLSLRSCESLINVDGLANLTNLTKLSLEYCESLINVDGLANLKNLKYLRLSSYMLTHFDKLEGSTNIITLDFSGDVMTELPAVPEFFKNVKEVILYECYDLEDLEGLVNFPNVTHLDLSCCFENDREEMISEWGSAILPFPSLEVLTRLKKLKKLDLSSSEYHYDLSPALLLDNLNELIFHGSTDGMGDDWLSYSYYASKFTNLISLDLSNSSFKKIDGLTHLKKLNNLNLQECYCLENIDVLANLTNLTSLDLNYCESLTNIDGLANLTNLTSLNLRDCESLTNVDGLANLTNLKSLDLGWCESLTNVDSLANLSNLNYLNLEGCYNINVIPDGYTMKEEDNESVESLHKNRKTLGLMKMMELEGEELKSYLQKIREHSNNKLIDQKIRISSNNKSVDQKNKEIQVTLFARELTFCDLEFKESEISSIDKVQNLIDEVIEFSDEERTSHMILGSIDNNNSQKLSEKRYSAKNYYEEKSFTISINNLGSLVNEPSQKKIKLIHYYYYENSSYILKLNGLNKKLLIDVKNFDSEAVILHHSTKDYELDLLYANTGGLYRIACMFDDGHIIKGTISEKSKFIDEVFKYHKNK